MERLREHEILLRAEHGIILRPMTEADWPSLLLWNQDRELLRWSDDPSAEPKSLELVQAIYRGVSEHAFNFMIELDGILIGECWLQEMNLARVLELYPSEDVRRVDIMIGDKSSWSRGYGTAAIKALVRFGFDAERCDRISGVGIDLDNARSIHAFEKAGFTPAREIRDSPDRANRFDFEIDRARYATAYSE